jgi:hypothetical protein
VVAADNSLGSRATMLPVPRFEPLGRGKMAPARRPSPAKLSPILQIHALSPILQIHALSPILQIHAQAGSSIGVVARAGMVVLSGTVSGAHRLPSIFD